MGPLRQDVRYAVRALRRRPGFTVVAVVTLALGIGATTAVFSAFNALILKPLPFREPGRLVSGIALRQGFDPFNTSLLEYDAYRRGAASLLESGVGASRSFHFGDRGEPENLQGAAVDAEYLETLDVRPVVGRRFTREDDRPGGPSVALLGWDLWRGRFGGAGVVGRAIRLDDRPYTVIGVLPRGFDMPAASRIWVPLQVRAAALPLSDRAAHRYQLIARLKPGVSRETADAELKGISRQLEKSHPAIRRGWTYRLIDLRQQLLGDLAGRTRRSLVMLNLAVGFLLLICCANVASLLLASGASRESEMAIRQSLGAGDGRLLRQLLTESVVLAAIGGCAGVLLAFWLLPVLARSSPVQADSLGQLLTDFRLDGRTLAFALATTLGTGILFGLVPALRAIRRRDLSGTIRRGQRSQTGSSNRRPLAALVVCEIAVATSLLTGGGLILRSFRGLQRVEPGFRTERLLTAYLSLPSQSYPAHAGRLALAERLLPRLRALPGVSAAGVSTNLPVDLVSIDSVFEVEGRAPANPADVPITAHRLVTPGYLETLGVTLVRGRLLDARDRSDAPPVAVVSEELARQAWAGRDPIGKRVRRVSAGRPDAPWLTVVGIVRDVKEDRFNFRADRPVWYLPYAQQTDPLPADWPLALAVRTTGDRGGAALASAIREAVRSVDPTIPVSPLVPMSERLAGLLVAERFGAVLLGALAVLGLVLAAVGLYGTLAFLVRQRRGEIGLRMALGARPADIFGLVMGRGLWLVAAGLAAGLPGARVLSSFLSGNLYRVSASDPATFGVAAAILAGAALAACFIPARRAAAADPMTALRDA